MDIREQKTKEKIKKLKEKNSVTHKVGNLLRDEGKKYVVLQDEIVYAGKVISDRCLKVFLVMKRLAMNFGAGIEEPFHAPLKDISDLSGKPVSSIQEIIVELIGIGLVRKEKRSRKEFGEYNIYFLADGEEWWEKKGKYLDQRNDLVRESKRQERAEKLKENVSSNPLLPDSRL